MRLFLLFGYLDPGTGSIIFQSIIGIVAGVAVFGRKAVHLVVEKVKSPFRPSATQSQDVEKSGIETTQSKTKNV